MKLLKRRPKGPRLKLKVSLNFVNVVYTPVAWEVQNSVLVRELKLGLERPGGAGGGGMCTVRLVHAGVWRGSNQYCKAITLPLKI